MNIQLIASGSRLWELWIRHWGLSFLIDDSILFDTFANHRTLSRKLRQNHIDIARIRDVVISHDHWDHIDGLWGLLERRKGLNVYLPPHAHESCKDRIRAAGSAVIDNPGTKTLRPNIHVTAELTGTFEGRAIPEQSIVLETRQGLVVIVGCSHPGVLAIAEKAKQHFKAPVHAVIGGFHLMESSRADILRCAVSLWDAGVHIVAPTHCTGRKAEKIFHSVFGKGFIPLREGQTLSFL